MCTVIEVQILLGVSWILKIRNLPISKYTSFCLIYNHKTAAHCSPIGNCGSKEVETERSIVSSMCHVQNVDETCSELSVGRPFNTTLLNLKPFSPPPPIRPNHHPTFSTSYGSWPSRSSAIPHTLYSLLLLVSRALKRSENHLPARWFGSIVNHRQQGWQCNPLDIFSSSPILTFNTPVNINKPTLYGWVTRIDNVSILFSPQATTAPAECR